MKLEVPEALKADMPQTTWGKILSATPVAMAVVATLLAGLASSEMTRAQYDRSLAAQQQSKAGDQWSFFQAKRMRAALQRNTLDLLQNLSALRGPDAEAMNSFVLQLPDTSGAKSEIQAVIRSPAGKDALEVLKSGQLPEYEAPPALAPEIKSVLNAVEELRSDSEIRDLLSKVTPQSVGKSLQAAQAHAQRIDAAMKPMNQAIDQIEGFLTKQGAAAAQSAANPAGPSISRDFSAARLRYAAARYEMEARLNQTIANLYELQVRQSNASAERHHARSQQFFYGMLGAQAAVIIATFAMAARNRSLLWSIAAAAGLIAIAFAVYVYLYL